MTAIATAGVTAGAGAGVTAGVTAGATAGATGGVSGLLLPVGGGLLPFKVVKDTAHIKTSRHRQQYRSGTTSTNAAVAATVERNLAFGLGFLSIADPNRSHSR
jgi:hypothetical protein